MTEGSPGDGVRVGVCILPDARWREAASRWRIAEELGFDHAWTYDHLAWRDLRDDPWFSAIPTLTAAALTTSSIRLGTLVTSPNFRHPVPFARELLTLDDLSSGRLDVGIGAGGTGWDATMLGHPPWSAHERAERFADFVDLLDRLLRDPATDHRTTHYAADGARSAPGPLQLPRPPFAIAATGPRGLRLAARYAATWVTYGATRQAPRDGWLDPLRSQLTALAASCDELGRDPTSIRRLVLTGPQIPAELDTADGFRAFLDRIGAIGITDVVVHWPRHADPYAGDEARFREVVASTLARRR